VRSLAIVAAVLFCGQLGSGQATSTSSTTKQAATKQVPATKRTVPVSKAPAAGKAPAANKASQTKAAAKTVPTKSTASSAPKSGVAAPAQKSVAKGSGVAKAATNASKSPAPVTVSSTASNKKAAAKRPPPPRYYTQQQPTADRYREIQRALAERGYFQGSADGTWGSESVEALRRFQADQNLEVDGKLGSLSLIALGLGPRRDGATNVHEGGQDDGHESSAGAPVPPAPEVRGVEPAPSESTSPTTLPTTSPPPAQ